MAEVHGRFPFGRPNTERPWRQPSRECQVLVVGVYPSALHVAWWPPETLDPRPAEERARPLIGSLAIDVEPVVFWDGKDPSPPALVEAWKRSVSFGEHWGRVIPGRNGPSGASVADTFLTALGINPDAAAMTDLVPWFFAKRGANSQRDVAEKRLTPIAAAAGIDVGDLPPRPGTRALVAIASSTQRERLRKEIQSCEAPLVISLGQEAADGLRAIADSSAGVQERLAPDHEYGKAGELKVDEKSVAWRALVHPGFLRQTKDGRWLEAHDRSMVRG